MKKIQNFEIVLLEISEKESEILLIRYKEKYEGNEFVYYGGEIHCGFNHTRDLHEFVSNELKCRQ